jgi:hypothetical protein
LASAVLTVSGRPRTVWAAATAACRQNSSAIAATQDGLKRILDGVRGTRNKLNAMIVPKATSAGPEVSRGGVGGTCLACCVLVLGVTSGSAQADGMGRFLIGERGPFNALVGIPQGWPDFAGSSVGIGWNMASHAMAEESGTEGLLLDGETHALTLRVQRQVAPRLVLGLSLPWIAHGGGFLDPFIDGWHDAFGLSEGIRPELPRDELRFVYVRDGTERFVLDDATSGIGDLRSAAVLRLAGEPDAPGALRLDLTAEIKWPTGDADRLTGSGSTDFAAGMRLSGQATPSLAWALDAGLLWPGTVELPLPAAAGQVPYYEAVLAWAAFESVELIVQVNGHAGVYRSGLDALGGQTLQLGAGATWRLGERYGLRFGVFEDIRTDTAPDFAMELAVVVGAGRDGSRPRRTGPITSQPDSSATASSSSSGRTTTGVPTARSKGRS